MLCTLYFSNRYAINKTTVTVYLFSRTFDKFKKSIKSNWNVINNFNYTQGKMKEVIKKQEKMEVEEVEQEGPRGGKRGETDGEEKEVDGGGEDKDRDKEGEEQQGEEGEGHKVEGTQLQ